MNISEAKKKPLHGTPYCGFFVEIRPQRYLSIVFLTPGKWSYSPGSPRHSIIASCCSGVNACSLGLKHNSSRRFYSSVFSIIQRCSCELALRGVEFGK